MSLDEDNDSNAYQIGRLFAVLERIQKVALEKYDSESGESKKINSTITDRYFGSASTVPYSVFPRLLLRIIRRLPLSRGLLLGPTSGAGVG